MSDLPEYESILNILREAGFVLQSVDEKCAYSGNRVATAYSNYISPSDDNAKATKKDIMVSVNGERVNVASIDSARGAITLSEGIDPDSEVLVTYWYSPVPVEFVGTVRDDVECSINSKMRKIDKCVPYVEDVPYAVRMITRLWTAGLLLGKEYGYNADGENNVSDGYRRISEAKSLLEDFYNAGGFCGSTNSEQDNTGGSGDVLASSQDLFGTLETHARPNGDRFYGEF